MEYNQIINWLLKGDISLEFQVRRDLLDEDRPDLQNRIATEGWGKLFLSKREANLNWGESFYQPKWISTHYSLLDLRNLNLPPSNSIVKESIDNILELYIAEDGGIVLGPSTIEKSDLCVNGMFLNYASYFKSNEKKLISIIDSILSQVMPDGGFNCRTVRSGAKHSSLHTTISVLEGLYEFEKSGYNYRLDDIKKARSYAEEFILIHNLFLSDRTGEIINKNFLKFPYPTRWKYDILRAFDYFSYSGRTWDNRMDSALNIIRNKRCKNGLWKINASYPGKVHFVMEEAGKASRWNTLRALKIFKHFNLPITQ